MPPRASELRHATTLLLLSIPASLGFSPSVISHLPTGRFCQAGRLSPAASPAVVGAFPRFSTTGPASRRAFVAQRPGLRSAKASDSDDESLERLVSLPGRRYIFVGGKGGVGKTSTSAATAVKFADEGLRTLVISTDPAHSLGDALMTDLSSGKVTPISEQGGNLYALEVDLKEAVEEFKRIIAGLKSDETDSIASKLGLSEMTDIFDTAPPGADELVALSKVISLVEEGEAKTALGEIINFDRVVIDTAPTGHTLRLLEYPRFISRLITKALALKLKLGGSLDVVSQAASFLGAQLGFKAPDKESIKQGGEKLNEKAEKFRDRMQMFDDLLHDPSKAEFLVVCIPTGLSSSETGRLVPKLLDSGVAVRHVVINQILQDSATPESYLERLKKEQKRTLGNIKSSPHTGKLNITEVPLFDTEVTSVYGLRALGGVAFKENLQAQYGGLFEKGSKSQFVFVGGKGGVGKTSTSSALGVQLADAGLKTLIISTDPAHSLGDCLAVKLAGEPVEIEGTQGNLWAMEVDTEEALEKFKSKLRSVSQMGGRLGDLGSKIGLDEFADILENPPPGTDEVVALGDVMDVMREGTFDRVIVDTAPTGHTLRLLSFPDFLDGFLQKVLGIKRKLDGAINTAKSLFGISADGGKKDEVEEAAAAIERQRLKAVELRELLTDAERTQFLVVSIATQLSFAESERLVQGLAERGVAVDNLIVNQLLGDSADAAWVHRVAKAQGKQLQVIRQMADKATVDAPGDVGPIWVREVPYFDSELQNIYALRSLAAVLFDKPSA